MSEHNNLTDIVIFGGHGDLAFRKLMPALYHICNENFLHQDSRIITVSRSAMSRDEHLKLLKEKMDEFLPAEYYSDEKYHYFCKRLEIVQVDFDDIESYRSLHDKLQEDPNRERLYYLSTAPNFFGSICKTLSEYGLVTPASKVVLEKPIGRDLESAKAINDKVLEYFNENQIYRIDHYLGKETVQNIMALRFSNRFFMPLWDEKNIDHVQITVSESVGVEGRWGYYDDYGALRDMIQNHLLQLVCLIAMEPPCSLEADAVRDEKVKVLKSLRPMSPEDIETKTVRAQYTGGNIQGEKVPGYTEGEGVSESVTETFAAMRLDINNWRWNRVPFYLRSGKRMSKRNSEIVIQFKTIPYSIFANKGRCIKSNKLIITLQPNESIKLQLMNKIPGLTEQMRLKPVELELNNPIEEDRKPEAYERLLLDVIRSNPTHFMRLDEVEAAWKWADLILQGWEENIVPMKEYSAGTDGPTASIALIERDGRSWHE
jgi:glucose-6-phosphate 1-dehydrogenase